MPQVLLQLLFLCFCDTTKRNRKRLWWKSAAPKPEAAYTPSKYSSLSGKDTDPYEADLYDDPDEYADRYAEEFADEMEEDADEGYQEAYDHWINWHETHD